MKKCVYLLLIFLCINGSVFAQVIVNGNVTDENNEPLVGTTVQIKDASSGTVTDVDGNYRLNIGKSDNVTLVFSFIGYKTMEETVNNRTTINVSMEPDLTLLSEVVAVGYGSQRRANLTGAVSTVDVSDAEGRAITSASQLLQGKIAGVNIVQNSGQPGNDISTIRIRGVSSIDNNNEPLVIIDGVESDFNNVHPSDIASISVLKDAASASIYGSRAAAGVIIIETKKGQTGKLKFDYTGSVTTQRPTRLPELINSWEYAELRNEARMNVGIEPYYTDAAIEQFKYGINPSYANTDWVDIFFDTAFMHNHHVSSRGGGENYSFFGSVGYFDQGGVLLGTSSDKLTYRTQMSADLLNKKLSIGFLLSGYRDNVKELPSGTNSVISSVVAKPSTIWAESIPDEYGVVRYSAHGRELGLYYEGGSRDSERISHTNRFNVHLRPLEGMNAKLVYSNSIYSRDFIRFVPEVYSGDTEGNPTSKNVSELQKNWTNSFTDTWQFTLDYSKSIKKHKFDALAGYERYQYQYKYDNGFVKDLSTNQTIFGFGDPTTHNLVSSANERSTVSYFGRFNYSYDNKYLLELNYRKDGSSRFAKENRWSGFPSLSGGWIISRERFMRSLNFIDQLKFRASWGRLGNQNIGTPYAASDRMSGSEYYAFGHQIVSGRGTTELANPNTRWETTEQTNLGFDLNMFNSFNMSFDYFYKTTYDILARVTIPPSLGINTNPYQNIGNMLNKGIELTMGYRSKYNPDGINFSIDGNFGYLKNEVTDLGVLQYVDHSNILRSQVGEAFSSIYGYVFEGIYQVDDFTWQDSSNPDIPHNERVYTLREGLPDPSGIMHNPQPGDLRFKDLVGLEGEEKPQITPEDKTIIGKTIADFTYGLSFNISYKNFELDVLGQGVAGIDAYQRGPMAQPFYNAGEFSVLREHTERRWTYENPSTKYMRLVEDKVRDALISGYYVFDASYFRLKNVELSYSLPKDFLKRYNIERCRFYISGENLLLITNYLTGFDPEKPSTTTSTGYHPQMATYTLGVNINF